MTPEITSQLPPCPLPEFDRGRLTLTANTKDVADTVRELFAQSSAHDEAVMGDE